MHWPLGETAWRKHEWPSHAGHIVNSPLQNENRAGLEEKKRRLQFKNSMRYVALDQLHIKIELNYMTVRDKTNGKLQIFLS